ncbi:hypothetical protein MPH_06991 [Macrophomina phaseolina MS6]|uniref:Uncharacterized protein n=1 Tax=Macrophomina phaseolina (strain MS6) TaxID=1126212 RepID=K2RM38_MACPH|nr:hypothetical protein MPH_06991 [Macrophomina phaseolina MS6]
MSRLTHHHHYYRSPPITLLSLFLRLRHLRHTQVYFSGVVGCFFRLAIGLRHDEPIHRPMLTFTVVVRALLIKELGQEKGNHEENAARQCIQYHYEWVSDEFMLRKLPSENENNTHFSTYLPTDLNSL